MAEIDADGLVLRVIVAPDATWPATHLGGTWVETSDPYGPPTIVAYCGPGWGCADGHPQRFAVVAPPGLNALPPGMLLWDNGTIVAADEVARLRRPDPLRLEEELTDG